MCPLVVSVDDLSEHCITAWGAWINSFDSLDLFIDRRHISLMNDVPGSFSPAWVNCLCLGLFLEA